MKTLSALMISCFLFAGLAEARGGRREQKRSNLSATILALEARRFKAMTEADLTALDQILADDLTYTHASGWTQSKSELIEALRSGKLRYLSIEPAGEKVRAFGGGAVGTGRAVFKVRLNGKEMNVQLRFLDVYVLRRGRWQLAAWQSTRLTP
jgi:Domain of unknown function (DUF4440)